MLLLQHLRKHALYSQVAPHLIQVKSDGQYLCDSNCQQWVSSQLCSHTLAAAERNGD